MLKFEKNTGLVSKTPADCFSFDENQPYWRTQLETGEFIRLLNCPEYGAKILLSGIRCLSSYKYSKINSALADCHIFGTNPTPSSSGEHWKGCLPYKCASTEAWVNNLIPLSASPFNCEYPTIPARKGHLSRWRRKFTKGSWGEFLTFTSW